MSFTVVGFPRSGTTLFYSMLRACVVNYDFLEIEKPAPVERSKVQERLITKRPLDVFRAELLDTHFLILIRDPRSILVSRHVTVSRPYAMDAHDNGWGAQKGVIQFYEAICWIMQNKSYTVVRYEHLLRHPQGVQNRMEELGMECQSKFQHFHYYEPPKHMAKTLNGLRPIDKSRIDSWKRHPERVIDQFTQHPELFQVVRELGYENSDRWFLELQQLVADRERRAKARQARVDSDASA